MAHGNQQWTWSVESPFRARPMGGGASVVRKGRWLAVAGALVTAATLGAIPAGAALDGQTAHTRAFAPMADGGPTRTTSTVRHADTAASQAALYGPYTTKKYDFGFSGSSVDQRAWSIYDTGHANSDARQKEFVSVSGGQLHLLTRGQAGSGICLCRPGFKPTKPYGRYDIRARVSANADHGFAILLWPNAGHWPETGEIDIAEYNGDRTRAYTTVHYAKDNKRIIQHTYGDFTQWHTYSVAWGSKGIHYLIDNRIVMSVTQSSAIPRDPLHLVLQAGANHPGHASNTSARLDVDWIRQYSAS